MSEIKEIKEGFKNIKDLRKIIKNTKNFHKILQERMEYLMSKIWDKNLIQHELYSIPGGRVDTLIYSIYGVKAHFEYICSKNQVTQDLRLLELSNALIKIAVIIDDDLKEGVLKHYYHKNPLNTFPIIFISELLLESNEKKIIRKMKFIMNSVRENIVLAKNKGLRKLALERIDENCKQLWSFMLRKPIYSKSKEISLRNIRLTELDIMLPEKNTGMMREWNILQVGMHSGINEFVYPELMAYRPDILELAEEMRTISLLYFSKIDDLFNIVRKDLIVRSRDNNKLKGSVAYILDTLKIEEENDQFKTDQWQKKYYIEVKRRKKKLDKIKSKKEIVVLKEDILKIIAGINSIQWTIKNIIEFEMAKN